MTGPPGAETARTPRAPGQERRRNRKRRRGAPDPTSLAPFGIGRAGRSPALIRWLTDPGKGEPPAALSRQGGAWSACYQSAGFLLERPLSNPLRRTDLARSFQALLAGKDLPAGEPEGGTSDETSACCRHGCGHHARRGERGPADHTHVLILPNGKCAILAAAGNEKYLILPSVLFDNNPNVDADDAAGGLDGLPLNRRHPLHVLVHLGVPGADGEIAVMGSAQDPCAATGDYVNG